MSTEEIFEGTDEDIGQLPVQHGIITPLGVRGLEVYWPARDNAKQSVTRLLADLRHGGTVVVPGNMETAEITVEP